MAGQPPRCRARRIVAVDADPRSAQELRCALGVGEGNQWMKGSSTQAQLSQSRQQLRLGAARRMNHNGSRREPSPSRRSGRVDELGQRIVDLIVAHGDDYRVGVADRRWEISARRCHRRMTTRVETYDIDVRGAEGPEQSNSNLSGAEDEYALTHSLAGWVSAFFLAAARSRSAA